MRIVKIRDRSGKNQAGIAAARKAEEADAARIDLCCFRRGVQHEIDETFDICRSLDEDGYIARLAHVGKIVARMVQGNDDETGIRQGFRRIVMAERAAGMTMRDDDQRQIVAHDRAIPDTRNDDRSKRDVRRRNRAGRPD